MPYVGELIVDTVSARIDHAHIENQPSYATVDQLVALNGATVQQRPLKTVQGNVASNTHEIDLIKEVSQALDDLKIPTRQVKSSRDKGYTGEIRHDSEYIYICVSTNNWKRVKLESF